jgi:hypothetical protein
MEFYPTPIASLPTMTLKMTKPNGDMVGESKDGGAIMRIQYDATNRYYLQIVMSRYFERNAFLPGDVVIIKNFHVFHIDPCQDPFHISLINQFINRENGHEVTGLGEANDNGYYRTFYIRGPGKFDDLVGSFAIAQEQVDQLVHFNSIYDYDEAHECEIKNGNVMNLSMQYTVSFVIRTQDPKSNGISEPLVSYA